MGEYGFTEAQAGVLEEGGYIAEAAKVHQEEGRVLEAIRLFSSAPTDAESMKSAYRSLLGDLWKHAPLGTSSETMQETPEIQAMLLQAQQMGAVDIGEEIHDEVREFTATSRFCTKPFA